MGFNFAGIAVNRTFDYDINKVADAFGWNIKMVKEVTFDEASQNWTPERDVNIHFTDKSTMIFLSFERCISAFGIQGANVLTFAYSATSMAMLLHYWENDKVVRYIMEHNHEIMQEHGEKLPQEQEGKHVDGLIFDMLEEVLGRSFHQLDFAGKAYHCKFQ